MKNVRPIHADELGVIHFNPKTGVVTASKGGIIYVDLTALEKDDYINRKLPLSLKLFCNQVMGYFDGKNRVINLEFPTSVPIEHTVFPQHIQVSRKAIEKYLKSNPKTDTIILAKSDKNANGIRHYNIELDREGVLANESDTEQHGIVPVFSARDYFNSKEANK